MMPARRAEPAGIVVRPYRLRLALPLQTSRGPIAERLGFVVEAHSHGLVGRGEAAPLPWLGTETLEECEAALRNAPGLLAALDLRATPAARCAVEQALLDLSAQEAGVPLARWLHPEAAASVPCSALLASTSMADLAREAKRLVAAGFGTLKLKVGLRDDFARAAVVRDAVGPRTRLRLDANGAWDAVSALRRLRELAPLDIELCEQPTPDLRHLEGSPIPVAADEMLASDPDGALARADVLVLKPVLLGGILPALDLARRAREGGRGAIVTSSLEGAIGRAGAAHLAAAVLALGPQPAAGLATGRLLAEDLCDDALAPSNGVIAIPSAVGLGLS